MVDSAAMPIVTLKDISLAFGTDQILDGVDLSLETGERIAVTGRNGAGKSTLLGLISGQIQEDSGIVWRADNLKLVQLPQDLPDRSEQSVYEAVSGVFSDIGQTLSDYHQLTRDMTGSEADNQRLSELQALLDHAHGWNLNHLIEATLDRLGLDPEATLQSLSGGWLKRVAIARSLVQSPDVWILDEPTNHLDLAGIQWLESLLLDFPGTVLFVSHDRQLMQSVATAIIEIDRGKVTRFNCDYHTYLDRREKAREVEAEHNRQFDSKLASEEAWIRQGIKARRTRNEGRVRALKAMREEHGKRISQRALKLQLDGGAGSGQIVKEVTQLSKSLGGKSIVTNLDLIIQRGDRIGLLGPNGCGKTTFLKLLLDEIEPDSGSVKTGSRLQIAYFDQAREQLDPNLAVNDYIADGREFISINGKEIHVVTYLRNFLFDADQSRAPIRTLSGGEQNRLLLARLFSQPTNLLVLDEPTNDLDVETLELLEDLLMNYRGTVLLVSHDRAFLDNVVSSILVFEGDGIVREYAGGYSDWLNRQSATVDTTTKNTSRGGSSSHDLRKKEKAAEQKRLRDIEKVTREIDALEQTLKDMNQQMAESGFFEKSPEYQNEQYARSAALEEQLVLLMTRWEDLEAGSVDPADESKTSASLSRF